MEVSGGGFAANSGFWLSGGSGTSDTIPLIVATDQTLFIRGVLNIGATGGTVNMQWAQAIASASSVSLVSGSYMVVYPIP
jgi:hypothetical protein